MSEATTHNRHATMPASWRLPAILMRSLPANIRTIHDTVHAKLCRRRAAGSVRHKLRTFGVVDHRNWRRQSAEPVARLNLGTYLAVCSK